MSTYFVQHLSDVNGFNDSLKTDCRLESHKNQKRSAIGGLGLPLIFSKIKKSISLFNPLLHILGTIPLKRTYKKVRLLSFNNHFEIVIMKGQKKKHYKAI